ncbi:MAG TPA: HAD-IIB family hydrolase [Anaerolineales bacterium]|nr:HAD-IIB family hydrolase [Anaerolineales bacterium]
MLNNKLIRLLVFDIDGVLTKGEGKPLDLELLKDLALINQAARKDPALPAVTLCTGRPASYVEVMLQAIDGHLPAIFENGAGLYIPSDYKFLPHPNLQNRSEMRRIRQRLEETLVKEGTAYFQPGKEYTLSLFSTDPANKDKLHDQTRDVLGMFKGTFDFASSSSCLNILPRNIHKGSGIEFLCNQTGYNPSEMLGVGDSGVDIQFLSLVGFSAAPANADKDIKKIVQYISPYQTGEGVRDILKHFNIWS